MLLDGLCCRKLNIMQTYSLTTKSSASQCFPTWWFFSVDMNLSSAFLFLSSGSLYGNVVTVENSCPTNFLFFGYTTLVLFMLKYLDFVIFHGTFIHSAC